MSLKHSSNTLLKSKRSYVARLARRTSGFEAVVTVSSAPHVVIKLRSHHQLACSRVQSTLQPLRVSRSTEVARGAAVLTHPQTALVWSVHFDESFSNARYSKPQVLSVTLISHSLVRNSRPAWATASDRFAMPASRFERLERERDIVDSARRREA